MPTSTPIKTDFSLASLTQAKPGSSQGKTGSTSFSATLSLQLASFQSQTLGSLIGSDPGSKHIAKSSNFESLLANQVSSSSPLNGLSATGRNSALNDPESGYQMMSLINSFDVAFKAQISELSEMKSALAEMQQNAQALGGIHASSSNEDIRSALEKFVGQYNDWVQHFNADMESGGVLANTQAAQVSREELEQSIGNIFHGARDGMHGLRDLGISIDQDSRLASLDHSKLDAVLAGNRQGALGTISEFSANFARSASLLSSDNNLVANRLSNLSHAVSYIDRNKSSLQAEFGLGEPAKPSGQVAQALAAYHRSHQG